MIPENTFIRLYFSLTNARFLHIWSNYIAKYVTVKNNIQYPNIILSINVHSFTVVFGNKYGWFIFGP